MTLPLGRLKSAAAGPGTSVLLLRVVFKQCAPVLGDKHGTAAKVKSGRKF